MNLVVGCLMATVRCAASECYCGLGAMTPDHGPDAFIDFEFWDGCLMMCGCVCVCECIDSDFLTVINCICIFWGCIALSMYQWIETPIGMI